jgi:hypothetical protein
MLNSGQLLSHGNGSPQLPDLSRKDGNPPDLLNLAQKTLDKPDEANS